MHLDHLRYFVELANAGSFARASSALFISPQGLNKAIASIEAELGVNLVTRNNRGTTLTTDGAVFLAYAQESLARFDEMTGKLAAIRHVAIGDAPFTVGATSYALHTVFEGPFDPSVSGSIRVQEMGPTEITEAIESGDPRLFVTDLIEGSTLTGRCIQHGSFRPIFRTEFGVICHRDFPLNRFSLSVEELIHIPLVCYHDESIDWIMGKVLGGRDADNVLLRTSNSEQLIKYVMAKSAVSLLDSFAYEMIETMRMPYADSIRFIPVTGLPHTTTGFLFSSTSPESERAELFIDAYMIGFRQRYASYLRRHPL